MRNDSRQEDPSGISGLLLMPSTDAPPVNNACMPDIYNKLDAEAIEKSRVLNKLLDTRLGIQQRILNKHRCAAERFHDREKQRIWTELRRISHRLPTISQLPRVELQETLQRLRTQQHPPNGYVTTPREMGGLETARSDRPFCERYFVHHLPTKGKYYKRSLPPLDLVKRVQYWPRGKRSTMVGRSHDLHDDSKSEPIAGDRDNEIEDDLRTV